MNEFQIATKIYFGIDSLKYLSRLKYKRAFIVTDPFIIQSNIINKISTHLENAGISYKLFSEVVPNPPVSSIVKGIKAFTESYNLLPDVIIAVGGGSAIDTAKGICFFRQYFTKEGILKDDNAPRFIAIPTTSGTGSEVTDYCVITDEKTGTKHVLVDDIMVPDEAILDIELVKTVPPTVTADTGVDVLVHAIEAYVSVKASDFTDALAQKAIELVFDYLPIAYKNGKDEVARTKMHHASSLAGMAFFNTGLGINHGMAHAVGAKFNLSHGRANGILLPHVMRYNSCLQEMQDKSVRAAERYAQIAEFLGISGKTSKEKVEGLIKQIEDLLKEVKIPNNFKDAGISYSEYMSSVSELAVEAINDKCTATNPKVPLQFEIEELFKTAFSE